jgi:hypothetical protein
MATEVNDTHEIIFRKTQNLPFHLHLHITTRINNSLVSVISHAF